jgi:S-adenosylmethionine hydrolase
MAERPATIAIISDLGLKDPTIGQFKAAVVAINPNVDFVDVSHEIRQRDLLEAAFVLDRIFRDFQRRTAFVVLVEGVLALPKRAVLAVSMDYFYFAPDNGVLSYVYQNDDVSNVYEVTAEHLVKLPAGPRAAHRDVFAPAVAWLTKGNDSSNFGERIEDFVKTPLPQVSRPSAGELKGMVLHVDRFGALITNISEAAINAVRAEVGAQVPFRAVLGDASVPVAGAWAEGGPETIAVYGPGGYLEIIAPKGDASKVLNGKRGDGVRVVFG